MAIIEKKTIHGLVVRFDDNGVLKGAHIDYRLGYVDDVTDKEVAASLTNALPVALTDGAPGTPLSDVLGEVNMTLIANQNSTNEQVVRLTEENEQLSQQVRQLQAQLSEASVPNSSGVPQVVSRKQGRAALIIAGLLDKVQPLIDSIADPVQRALAQNSWDNASTFERNDPFLVQIAQDLGLSESQMDDLFIQAAKL